MNKACGKRLARLNSYIRVTSSYRQYSHARNAASECRLGLFQDADFAGDLADSKSTSGGMLGILGSNTLVPISRLAGLVNKADSCFTQQRRSKDCRA